MSAEDDGADLEQLFSRWKHVSDKSSQYASLANVVLARILGTVRAKTKWGAEKLQENLVRFGAERSLGFSHLMDCLGEKAVRLPAKRQTV